MDISYYKKYEPIFGKWHIVREIGEGSFGKVFEIEREDFGYTYKAAMKAITIPQSKDEIKNALAEGMDENSVNTYYREAVREMVDEFVLMAKLKGHSNIVSYEDHTVIAHEDGLGWDILIRMELLTPLLDHLQANVMDSADIIRLGTDMCRALEQCKKFNIIHRDIKPENMFVSELGDFKLGDFGVARTAEKTMGGMSKKGTYTYMAPEVYKSEKYGSSSDIYSLGIVLYRLCNNNRAPFLPAYPATISFKDRENAIARRIMGEAIPAPSTADSALAEVILKACAYNPKDRYASPTEMREALEAVVANSAAGPMAEEPTVADDDDDKTVGLFGGVKPAVIESPSEAVTVPEADEEENEAPAAEAVTVADEVDDDKTVGVFVTEAKLPSEEIIASGKEPVRDEIKPDDHAPTGTSDDKASKEKSDESISRVSKKSGLWKKWAIAILAIAALAAVVLLLGIFNSNKRTDINKWTDIVAVSAGRSHTVGLKSDGTLVAVGNNNSNCCDISDWSDIVAIDASEEITAGIKSDGTVLLAGNTFPLEDAENWNDIISIGVQGGYHRFIAGLKSDGTVVATGYNEYGQCDVSEWQNVVSISVGAGYTIGLKADGTVVAAGVGVENGNCPYSGGERLKGYDDSPFPGVWNGEFFYDYFGECNVFNWTDIVAIDAGLTHTVGLKSDGTVVATGSNEYGECNVSDWTDIIAISAGKHYTVGLKSDGTVVSVGQSSSGNVNVTGWENVVAISAGRSHAVGILKDGTVVATGANRYGQCNVR